MLAAQAWQASARDYLGPDDAPGPLAPVGAGPELRLLVAGDSTAVGIGATSAETTVAGRLAQMLAERTGRRVVVTSVAVSGARTRDLPGQLQAAAAVRPDVVLILAGANDAVHLTALEDVRRGTREAVQIARDAGAQVVVATAPDLGGARNFAEPLRAILAWRGRAVADAQAPAVEAAGGVPVPLGALTGPVFRADPSTLSSDLFHPSDRGYAVWAEALTPAVAAAA